MDKKTIRDVLLALGAAGAIAGCGGSQPVQSNEIPAATGAPTAMPADTGMPAASAAPDATMPAATAPRPHPSRVIRPCRSLHSLSG